MTPEQLIKVRALLDTPAEDATDEDILYDLEVLGVPELDDAIQSFMQGDAYAGEALDNVFDIVEQWGRENGE